MDVAAASLHSGSGLTRLLEHCEAFARLIGSEPVNPRCRLEDALGRELAGRLLGALTRRNGSAVLPL